MKDLIKFGVTLSFICFVSAGFLAAVNRATEGVILERKQLEANRMLKELFPEAERFNASESEDKKIYIALSKSNRPLGYAFKAKAKGYASDIESLVSVDLKDKIISVKILSQNETPGVGTKVTGPDFLDEFIGAGLNQDISVDTISGATISSSALIGSIEKDAQAIKDLADSKLKEYGK